MTLVVGRLSAVDFKDAAEDLGEAEPKLTGFPSNNAPTASIWIER